MINKTSLLYVQMLLLFLPISSVLISKLLHAFRSHGLTPCESSSFGEQRKEGKSRSRVVYAVDT